MKRDEFYLGALVYTLIIGAGFYQPIREKIGSVPWDKPIYSFFRDHSHPSVPVSNPQVQKVLVASTVRRILTPDHAVSVSETTQESIRQNLAGRWEKMASHPMGLGQETESTGNAPPLLGTKTGSKAKSVLPDKKASGVEEPLKG